MKLCSNIFEAADNNFDDLNSDHWDQYPITMAVWYCWELWHRLFVYQWYVCRPQHPATRSTGWGNDVITLWWSRASWSKFYVLVHFLFVGVTFFALERFYYPEWLSFGYAVTWCMTSYFMVITWILVWFFVRLGWNFRLGGILFVSAHFTPWCNQPNLGMIFLRFRYNFRFSEFLFPLVSLDILVWLTASWYDFLRLFRRSVILFDFV